MPKNPFDVNVNCAKNWSDRSFLNRWAEGGDLLPGGSDLSDFRKKWAAQHTYPDHRIKFLTIKNQSKNKVLKNARVF